MPFGMCCVDMSGLQPLPARRGPPTKSCPRRLPCQAQEEAERQLVGVQQQLGEALAEAADAQVSAI